MVNQTSESTQIQHPKKINWGQQVRRVLKIALITYTLVAILLGFFQRKMLYRPDKAKSLPVAANREIMRLYPDSKDLKLTCADGTKIGGWWLYRKVSKANTGQLENARRPLILYFHGNARHRGTRGPWYNLFADVGADVLAIDYHGYGDSEGRMTEAGMYLSCDAAWTHATKELKYKPSEILVAGTSLGGAGAVYTAFQRKGDESQPAALVVISSFSSMVETAASLYPWLPVGALLMDRYPSENRIKDVECPIVVLHGDQDRLVYPRHGRKLFDAAPEKSESGHPKQWVNLNGIGHHGLVRLGADQIKPVFNSIVQRVIQQR